MMRIAFVTLGYPPYCTSGLDISGERLVRALLESGHQVSVIAGARSTITETHTHPALEIHRVLIGPSDWIGFSYRAARLLKFLNQTSPFEVVHFWDIHFAYAYSGKFLGSLHQSFRQRLHSLDWRHDSLPPLIYRFIYYSLARLLAETSSVRRASALLAVSSTTGEEFANHYKVPPERIALSRHGIDTAFFHRTDTAGFLRSQLGIARQEPVILFAGFITPRKGLQYLARALPLMHPVPRLVIIGRWRSKEYREQVLRLFGPAASRVIEAGFVPEEKMPAYYSLADVYVSPSLLEGFGLPLAEAMACETPIVTTNTGSAAEVVGPGGVLVPPYNPTALASAVSDLLNDASRRRELGKRGREFVVNNFSIQTMLQSTLEAYKRFKL
jgi:glycosyltransferase involved in cell wall biosynthesis